MGMSSWILDIEETFFDQVESIIKDSDTFEEARDRAVSLGKPVVPHYSANDIETAVSDMWSEYWSKYA
tara:strand:- start:5195 stop:5398 length:204 start_codon:yes stop_codon:yes gene_type:complete